MKIIYPKSSVSQILGIILLSLFTFTGWSQTCQSQSPGSLTVTATTQTTASFSWNSGGSFGGIGYNFEVRTEGLPGMDTDPILGYVTGGFTNGTSVTVSGLDVNTQYIFHVQYQCTEFAGGGYESIVFQTEQLVEPVAQAAIYVEDDSFLAIWEASEGAIGYRLDVSTDITFTDPEQFVTYVVGVDEEFNDILAPYHNWYTTATSKVISGLMAETTYYYRVRAVMGPDDVNDYSTGYSNTITVTTTDVPPTFVVWTEGGWTSDPTPSLPAIMAANFDSELHGNIIAQTLTINSDVVVTISAGGYARVVNGITNNAGSEGFIIKSNGNLYQQNAATNVGDITVERESSLIKRLDYTMWSSPTSEGETADQTLKQFSPMTLNNRFYTLNTLSNAFSVVNPTATTFEPGRGYLIRAANDHDAITPTRWLGVFKGIPNNGTITTPISDDGPGAALGVNMVGNPYPSVLVAGDFIEDNVANIQSTIYFWRRTNNPDEDPYDAQNTYYASYNYVGGVAATDAGPASVAPNGFILPGQGFLVRAKAGATSVFFDNTMRNYTSFHNVFFRNSDSAQTTPELEKHRIWLNLTNEGGAFGQMLLGYVETATEGVDDKFDGLYINDGGIALTSFLDNNEYIIQGRSLPFNNADVVPLNFKTPFAGTYSISISQVDGLFAGDQDIFIKDNLTSVTHNLKDSPYTFATEAGSFSDRFEVLYQSALGINDPAFNANSVVVYKQNDAIMINSGNLVMASVKVFDIRGRLLVENANVNASETSINPGAENQVLIVQITSNDNQVVTKKVVN